MPALMFLAEALGAPIAAGYFSVSVLWVVLAALIVSSMSVSTGWRAGNADIAPSVAIGAIFSLIIALPVFYLTAWLPGSH